MVETKKKRSFVALQILNQQQMKNMTDEGSWNIAGYFENVYTSNWGPLLTVSIDSAYFHDSF
jgi:hypothetical protein